MSGEGIDLSPRPAEPVDLDVHPPEVVAVDASPAAPIELAVGDSEDVTLTVTGATNVTVEPQPPSPVLLTVHDPEPIDLTVRAVVNVGGVGVYRHHQAAPALAWLIEHNLGYYPSVSVQDSAGTMIEGDVTYVDEWTVTVSFSAPFGGYANLS